MKSGHDLEVFWPEAFVKIVEYTILVKNVHSNVCFTFCSGHRYAEICAFHDIRSLRQKLFLLNLFKTRSGFFPSLLCLHPWWMLLVRVQRLLLCLIASSVSEIGFEHVAAEALCLWNTHATRLTQRAPSTLHKHADTAVCFLIEELFVRKKGESYQYLFRLVLLCNHWALLNTDAVIAAVSTLTFQYKEPL